MDKQLIISGLKKATDENALPFMTPDVIDDFVTYLHPRVDLRSFAQSDPTYKLKMYKQFLLQYPKRELMKIIVRK
jgi:hypothetical protein